MHESASFCVSESSWVHARGGMVMNRDALQEPYRARKSLTVVKGGLRGVNGKQ